MGTTEPLIKNGHLVGSLGSSLRRGGEALEDVPGLLRRVLQEQAWRDFTDELGKPHHHERFVDFVVTKPLAGLGATERLIHQLVQDDATTVDLLDQALQGHQGARSDLVNNIHEVARPAGTSEAAAIRRLRKDRPDLHAQVLAGELSAHGAAVQAGFRPRTITIPIDSPERIARTLIRHLTDDQLLELIQLLGKQ